MLLLLAVFYLGYNAGAETCNGGHVNEVDGAATLPADKPTGIVLIPDSGNFFRPAAVSDFLPEKNFRLKILITSAQAPLPARG